MRKCLGCGINVEKSESDGCGHSLSSDRKHPDGLKLLYTPEDGEFSVDIICIHGLNGHSEKTWTSDSGVFWIRDLLPRVLPHSRVFSFGYHSKLVEWRSVVPQNRIDSHSRNLLHAVASYRDLDNSNTRPIIFVTHSLGGLVCQDALVQSRNSKDASLHSIVKCTIGIAFLGTPHSGSSLATWAAKFCKLVGLFKSAAIEIVQVLMQESEVLARIQTDFQTMIRTLSEDGHSIEITCFFEEIAFPVVGLIVPWSSAVLRAYPHYGIHANHRNMVRFDKKEDAGFLAISRELWRWAKSLEPVHTTKSTTQMGKHYEVCQQFSYIPYNRHEHFIGRESILYQLKSRLETENCVSLSGIGGVGKSEIAIEFCYRLQDESPGANIFWVPADTVSKFEHAYIEIAETLGLVVDHETDINSRLELVQQHLSRSDISPYIMVIDNVDAIDNLTRPRRPSNNSNNSDALTCVQVLSYSADDTDTSACHSEPPHSVSDVDTLASSRRLSQSPPLMSYIPNSSVGKVVVTTRDHHVGQVVSRWNPIRVENLSPEDAKNMFCSAVSDELKIDEDLVYEILKILDFLPLAITLATAYIKRNNITVGQYHRELTESDTALQLLLNEDQFDSRKGFQSVTRSWKLSFDDILCKNVQASDLLSVMSLLDGESLPRDLLLQTGQTQHQLTTALGILHGFSLIKADKGGETFSMHRLVQMATRSWMNLKGTTAQFRQTALILIANKFPTPEAEDREMSRQLTSQARAVESYATNDKTSQIYLGQLHFRVASHYWKEGLFQRAEESCTKAFRSHVASYGRCSIETFHTSNLLGKIAMRQGSFEDAFAIHKDDVRYKEQLLGENHLDTIQSMCNLADVQWFRGEFVDAIFLNERVLKVRTQELGAEHLDTITVLCDLAHLKTHLGQLEEAESLARRAYITSEKALAEIHPQTLKAASVLASIHRNNGHYLEALKLSSLVLDRRTKVLGENHPTTLAAGNDLGLAYRLAGELDKAEKLLRQVTQRYEDTLGPNSPYTIQTTFNLSTVLTDQGKFEDAKLLSHSSLRQKEAMYGKDNPATLKHQNAHANLLDQMGESEEALKLVECVLEATKRSLGDSHIEVFNSMSTLASIQQNKKDLDGAEKLFEEALQGRLVVLRKNHPLTLESRFSLGMVYLDRLKLEAALQEFRLCLKGTHEEYGEYHKLSLKRLEKVHHVEKRLSSVYDLSLRRPSKMVDDEKNLSSEHVENVDIIVENFPLDEMRL